MTKPLLSRTAVLNRLRAHEGELRKAGAREMYIFGSVARDEARDGSDVDIFIEADREGRRFSLFDLSGLLLRARDILGCEVDMMTRQGIHPRRRERVEAEAVRVF